MGCLLFSSRSRQRFRLIKFSYRCMTTAFLQLFPSNTKKSPGQGNLVKTNPKNSAYISSSTPLQSEETDKTDGTSETHAVDGGWEGSTASRGG